MLLCDGCARRRLCLLIRLPFCTTATKGTILNEIGHGGSRDRKRGWVVHWPFWRVTRSKVRLSFAQSTLFHSLNCGSSLAESRLATSFSLSPGKGSFHCYAWNSRSETVCSISIRYAYDFGVFISVRDYSAVSSTPTKFYVTISLSVSVTLMTSPHEYS